MDQETTPQDVVTALEFDLRGTVGDGPTPRPATRRLVLSQYRLTWSQYPLTCHGPGMSRTHQRGILHSKPQLQFRESIRHWRGANQKQFVGQLVCCAD